MQTQRTSFQKKARLLARSFWKGRDDDDDQGPKGPPSIVTTFFRPNFQPILA